MSNDALRSRPPTCESPSDDWIELVQATTLLNWCFGMVELLREGSSLYVLQNFSLCSLDHFKGDVFWNIAA